MSDREQLEKIRIVLDLAHFGEIVAAVALRLCALRDIERIDDDELRDLAQYAWKYVQYMSDRVAFVEAAERDLAGLPTTETPLLERPDDFGPMQ